MEITVGLIFLIIPVGETLACIIPTNYFTLLCLNSGKY